MWNYAILSKIAKMCGGPEKFVNTVFMAGRQAGMKEMRAFMKPNVREAALAGIKAGRKEMVPFLFAAAVGGFAIAKLVEYFNNKEVSPEELEAAKAELIQGIKEYDASHPEKGDHDEVCPIEVD